MYFLEIGNGWSTAILRSEAQVEFLKAAMAYVVQRNWTYFIGGSNDNSAFYSDVQVTPFRYCASENSINDSGNIIQIFTILHLL